MAYCRFSDKSDVYLYVTSDDKYECCACDLNGGTISFDESRDAWNHILLHLEKGYKVPENAIDRLFGDVLGDYLDKYGLSVEGWFRFREGMFN